MVRVALGDDSALIREGVARLLADEGFEVVGQAGDADGLLALVAEHRPDVAIVDLRMPPQGGGGAAAVDGICADPDSATAVLVLSQYLEPEVALRLLGRDGRGVGYLLKDRVTDVATFSDAVRRVAAGGSVIDPLIVVRLVERRRHADPLDALGPREREVLELMAEGRSNRAIATRLFLSEKTVEAYIGSLFGKLGLEAGADDHRRVLAVLTYLQDR